MSLVSGRNTAEAQPRFYVRLDYDQAMAYWPKPVVTFTPDASTTLVYDDADSFWLDNPPTAFWAQFDVVNTGMPFTGEAITVSGAQDLANRADQRGTSGRRRWPSTWWTRRRRWRRSATSRSARRWSPTRRR